MLPSDDVPLGMEECRKIIAMLSRIPSRYSREELPPDPDFQKYYELGKAHLDMSEVDRIVKEQTKKAKKHIG